MTPALTSSSPVAWRGEHDVLRQLEARHGAVAEPLLRHEGGAEPAPGGDAERRRQACRRCDHVRRIGLQRRSPESASKNSSWPLPATPAMPNDLAAANVEADVPADRDAEADRRGSIDRCSIEQPRRCSTAARRSPLHRATSAPTIMLAKRRRRLLRGSQSPTTLPCAGWWRGGRALHLFEPVPDVEDGAPSRAQPLQRDEQVVGLLRRQHRGRLVHDDELRLLQQAAHDLDALALADRQVGDTSRSGSSGRPYSCETCAMRSPTWPRSVSLPSSASAMFSATVSASNSEKCWNTMPMPSARAAAGLGDARPARPSSGSRRRSAGAAP